MWIEIASETALATGFWCEHEGIYFTGEEEHGGEEGHFGYPCDDRELTEVAIVRAVEDGSVI